MMRRILVGVGLVTALAVPLGAAARPLLLCDAEPSGSEPRPIWRELAPPDGKGYPDYQTISNNLQVLNSLRLLASLAMRAAQSLQSLDSQVESPEAEGHCVCCLDSTCALPEIHANVLRENCEASLCSTPQGSGYPLWLPTDLFTQPNKAVRFFLQYVDFLDRLQTFVAQPLAQALQNLGTDLDNQQQLLAMYLHYVDLLTEGFHLGGYSSERPTLHLCVGYGGHGAFAEMANLFGEVSIGGRYTSQNLSREHRAQFRSGGFAVTAFGHTISLLPGIEANLQMDGFKLWDADRPFGIDLGALGQTCFPLADVDKFDLFDLVDASDLAPFDTSHDGCLQPGEFLIRDFYEALYRSAADGMVHTWPRPAFPYDWEKRNTAVLSGGLNLPLQLKPIEKLIPPSGIPIFPPTTTLYPKLTLKAGAEWTHQTNGLRSRLQTAVNQHLPAAAQLGPKDFERPMHALQAPDVSEDEGSSASVQPRVAADLIAGIALARYLRLGITVSLGTSVRVEPAAHGGVHDLNVALASALLNSNPPPDLPCDPTIEVTKKTGCSNELFEASTGTYTCDTSEETIFRCAEPEQNRSCRPPNAADDCPRTKRCLPQYGCHAHGYCERVVDVGPDGQEGTDDDTVNVEQDTTYGACYGQAVCDDAAVNAGAPCQKDADCFGESHCDGGTNAGASCQTSDDCPRGTCVTPVVPCVVFSPVGYFTPYECLVRDEPAITGWHGPGCHPLTTGFPSACGCAGDADCVAGHEQCLSGACAVGAQPVTCTCDPGNPSTCGSGRVCRDGACVLDCSANGPADCAANQTCSTGACVSDVGIPFAEQIVWQTTHAPKPQHAVASYALSDILTSAILDAGLWMGIDLRFAWKVFHFDLLDVSKYWTLVAFNKSRYQAGLEARYQHDCDPVAGATVSNWQPGAQRVTRYNPFNAGSGAYGNAGTLADLEQWCAAELPSDVADPVSPGEGDITTAAGDLLDWGQNIGVDVWTLGGLCVRQNGDGEVTSTPLTQWLSDVNAGAATLSCTYTYNNHPYSFPCADLANQQLLIWGCLDTNANPWAAPLASAFPNTLTTFASHPVFNLASMLIDPTAEFTIDNLQPQIRSHGGFLGTLWFAAVTQCFEQHHASLQPGDVHLGGIDLEPCCGNGQLDTAGCAQGPGVPPCEQCDDGNHNAGDGCSPLCRIEGRRRPLGACGNGIVERDDLEQCDDGNQIPGDGCEPDCTLTKATISPSPAVTPTPSARATATRTPRWCVGDCDGGGGVTVNELVTGVNIALAQLPASACGAIDANGDDRVTIDELVTAIVHALRGCPPPTI